MKILMIDNDGLQLQTRRMLLEAEIEGSIIDTIATLDNLHIVFKKGIYDRVIIDHLIENGDECIKYILEIDPMQPILIVSNAIRCVITQCEYCVHHHNIRRLSNPTPVRNIIRLVQRFQEYTCDHYDAETNKILT